MDVAALIKDAVTLDFETEKIQNRPVYPPKPVGLAIRWPDGFSEYLSWGHPEGNNCTKKQAVKILTSIWHSDAPLLFFNAKFDVAVNRLSICTITGGIGHGTE